MTSGGLRERKKQQTRDLISNIATRLFFERGFDDTTIAQVAEAADVSKMTVTNYFPAKEDLVFDRAGEIEQFLSAPVRERPAGTSVLDAVRRVFEQGLEQRSPILGVVGVDFARLVARSTALQVREREVFAAQERALGDVLHAEFAISPVDVRPRILAAQVAGVVRVLYFDAHRRLMNLDSTETIVRAARKAGRQAFDELALAHPALAG